MQRHGPSRALLSRCTHWPKGVVRWRRQRCNRWRWRWWYYSKSSAKDRYKRNASRTSFIISAASLWWPWRQPLESAAFMVGPDCQPAGDISHRETVRVGPLFWQANLRWLLPVSIINKLPIKQHAVRKINLSNTAGVCYSPCKKQSRRCRTQHLQSKQIFAVVVPWKGNARLLWKRVCFLFSSSNTFAKNQDTPSEVELN